MEWWQGTFEERMARRLARRQAQGLVITGRMGTWDRHGDKYVALRKRKARKVFNYEEWLHRRAGEQMAEEVDEWKAIVKGSRLHMIWTCVIEADNDEAFRRSPTLSQASRIKYTPRIRGCRAAAKRAGFAE